MINIATIEEKIYTVNLKPDTESHIKINLDFCKLCQGKECTTFCPANVFALSSLSNEITTAYENCLECGICKIGCPYEAIEYNHPKASFGVS